MLTLAIKVSSIFIKGSEIVPKNFRIRNQLLQKLCIRQNSCIDLLKLFLVP